MRTVRALTLAALTTTAALALAAPAHAATSDHGHCGDRAITQTTGTNAGILNGTQIAAPIDLGLNVTGNALALLGYATATGTSTNC